ncbi:hypothetical protein [Nocardioides sp. SYSU D00065]|uniref:hypothetical protein n=1 Tax=Nocardioides sp. SYSU D00065 TaxID=2817378 RepID=UPI001B33CD74|nr:hypothetical protein [Nocardioides sp. SYSU D00065]
MSRRPTRRSGRLLAAAGLLMATLCGQLAAAGSASAGQVGLTTHIRGAGSVTIVEGDVEDDGPTFCGFNSQQDDRVTRTCMRVRNSEILEAWLWLRAQPSPTPADNWVFGGWTGCHETREVDGFVECGVHSEAFNSVEAEVTARFVDVRPPEITAVDVLQHPLLERTYGFTWTTDRATSECQLDERAWLACSSPRIGQFAEGEHQFNVRAVDPSGNRSAVHSATFDVVDTEIVGAPSKISNSTSPTFRFSSAHAEDYVCSLDGGAEWPCATSAAPTTTLSALSGGLHELAVRARHGSAVDQLPAKYQWRIDTIAPETTITSFDATDDGARIAFVGDDADTFECRLTTNGTPAAWRACSSPHAVHGLGAGAYRLEVRGVDAAGNPDPTPESRTWEISGGQPDPDPDPGDPNPGDPNPGDPNPGDPNPGDPNPGDPDPGPNPNPGPNPGPHPGPGPDARAPETAITGGPEEDGIVLGRSVELTYASDEAAHAWRCTLDGQSLPCGNGAVALDVVTPGTHTFEVAAIDGAGHVDATPAARTFTVPASAKAMKRKGFGIKRSTRAWAGVEARATKRGARLSHSVTDARWVALVVTTTKRGGTIILTAAGKKQTVRLKSRSTQRHRIIRVPAFATPWSGKVTIEVKSNKRPVVIEGIAVATR